MPKLVINILILICSQTLSSETEIMGNWNSSTLGGHDGQSI